MSPKPPRDSREDRLKAALKANLARRKSQARARAANDTQNTTGSEQSPGTKNTNKDKG